MQHRNTSLVSITVGTFDLTRLPGVQSSQISALITCVFCCGVTVRKKRRYRNTSPTVSRSGRETRERRHRKINLFELLNSLESSHTATADCWSAADLTLVFTFVGVSIALSVLVGRKSFNTLKTCDYCSSHIYPKPWIITSSCWFVQSVTSHYVIILRILIPFCH